MSSDYSPLPEGRSSRWLRENRRTLSDHKGDTLRAAIAEQFLNCLAPRRAALRFKGTRKFWPPDRG